MSFGDVTGRTQVLLDAAPLFVGFSGCVLGCRERVRGGLRGIEEVRVDRVVETADDLAVADRVAFVLSCRTDRTHLVVATDTTYLVVTVGVKLEGMDAREITPAQGAPRIVSVATSQGIVPNLAPIGSLSGPTYTEPRAAV